MFMVHIMLNQELLMKNNVEHVSRSWPLGLVEDIDIKDPGILHTLDDEVYVDGPGRVDPSDPLLCQLKLENVSKSEHTFDFTFLENYNDDLVLQNCL